MRPTSPAQVEATAKRQAAPLEQLRDGIWAIAQPFGSGAEVYTLNYVIEDERGDLHLIDPGADLDANFAALGEQLGMIGHAIEDVATVTVTHLHHDHLGLAERVRAASGASIALHALEQATLDERRERGAPYRPVPESWGVPAERTEELVRRGTAQPHVVADVLLEGGELLPVPGRELRVVHTPGHTIGHCCIASEELFFSGDHVLPNQFAGVGLGGNRGTNPMRDVLESTAAIARFDSLEVCPGHGWRFIGLAERCRQTIAHHGRRTAEVAGVLEREPQSTIWQIASQLTWSAGWENLRGTALASALGQVEMHRELVLG